MLSPRSQSQLQDQTKLIWLAHRIAPLVSVQSSEAGGRFPGVLDWKTRQRDRRRHWNIVVP